MTLRSDGRVTISKHLRPHGRLSEGDELEVEVTTDGILRPCAQRDEDQWWYWTDEWQAGEQQIAEDRAAGRRGPVFASGDEFLAALRQVATTDGASDSSARGSRGP